MMEPISKRIAQAREEAGLTLNDLAAACETTKSTVQRWESGKHEPQRTDIVNMALALKVSPLWIMGYDVNKYDGVESTEKKIPVLNTPEVMVSPENIIDYTCDSEADYCLLYQKKYLFIKNQEEAQNGDMIICKYKDTIIIGEYITNQITPVVMTNGLPIVITAQKQFKIIGKVISIKYSLKGDD